MFDDKKRAAKKIPHLKKERKNIELLSQDLKQKSQQRMAHVKMEQIAEKQHQNVIHKLITAQERIKKLESTLHSARVTANENMFVKLQNSVCKEPQSTSPFLFNPLVVPVTEPFPTCKGNCLVHSAQCREQINIARKERNDAICVARLYRDVAEKCRKETRDTKHQLETKIHCVQNFWRNQVIAGISRSGQILRSALMKI